MTHLLDDNHSNGVHAAPTHTYARFKTVLRLPRERALRQVPAVPYPESAGLSFPTLLIAAVVGIAAWAFVVFAAFQLGRAALELIRHAIGGVS